MNINNIVYNIYKDPSTLKSYGEYLKKQPEVLVNFFKDLNNKNIIKKFPETSVNLFSLIETNPKNIYKRLGIIYHLYLLILRKSKKCKRLPPRN